MAVETVLKEEDTLNAWKYWLTHRGQKSDTFEGPLSGMELQDNSCAVPPYRVSYVKV